MTDETVPITDPMLGSFIAATLANIPRCTCAELVITLLMDGAGHVLESIWSHQLTCRLVTESEPPT
jgi:hypothetical protein